jgi:hypothetical protein
MKDAHWQKMDEFLLSFEHLQMYAMIQLNVNVNVMRVGVKGRLMQWETLKLPKSKSTLNS